MRRACEAFDAWYLYLKTPGKKGSGQHSKTWLISSFLKIFFWLKSNICLLDLLSLSNTRYKKLLAYFEFQKRNFE